MKYKKGMTLVELLVALAILTIFLAGAYLFIAHVQDSYARGEKLSIAEREAKQVLAQVEELVKNAHKISLTDTDAGDEKSRSVYFDGGQVYFREDGENKTPVALSSGECEMSFVIHRVTEGDGTTLYPNMMEVVITATLADVTATAKTSFLLPNIRNAVESDAKETEFYAANYYSLSNINLNLGGAGSGTGCFIATAAYESYEEPAVLLLRRFRDQILLPTKLGQMFVEAYYRYSPPLAEMIAQSEFLRAVVRIALLPLIGAAVVLLHPLPSLLAGVAFAAVYLLLRKRILRRRVVK